MPGLLMPEIKEKPKKMHFLSDENMDGRIWTYCGISGLNINGTRGIQHVECKRCLKLIQKDLKVAMEKV